MWYTNHMKKSTMVSRQAKTVICFVLAASMLLCCACELTGSKDTDNTVNATDNLIINEVVTSNGDSLDDPTYGSPDWIELYNPTSLDINLFGFILTDDILKSDKASLLPDAIIPAGGYLVVFANKSTEPYDGERVCLNFALKQTGGESLVLMDDNYNIIQELELPELDRDVSYARKSDGTYGYCAVTTPGEANNSDFYSSSKEAAAVLTEISVIPMASLIFTEVVSDNVNSLICTGCTECSDWVELYNPSIEEEFISGYSLSDDPLDNLDHNLDDFTIPSGGYVVIHCCRGECDDSAGHLCVDLGVKRTGETLYLFDSYGELVCSIEVPELIEDVSWAMKDDGSFAYCKSPTPGAANTTEFVDSYLPERVTFLSPVYINEVLPKNKYSMMDESGDRSDWVELYNSSSEPVTLKGFFLSDDAEELEKWAIPEVTIPAGGYLLIFLDGKESTSTELHASFALSQGEQMVLYDSNNQIYEAIDIIALPANVSIGRSTDGQLVYYRQPSPLAENNHPETEADKLGFFDTTDVYISEVSAIHAKGTKANDWIELYNGSDSAVSLDGWFLSDDPDNFTLWRIDGVSIESGAYAVIEATSHVTRQGEGIATFGISSAGEVIFLVNPNGIVVDVFDTGVQSVGMSSGRVVGDSSISRVFFTTVTKGSANSSSTYSGYSSQPVFSETELYQSSTFSLTISSLNADEIYYTTDGSKPKTSSKLYSGPITISGNTVIRAIAVCDGLLTSEITTCHYLFVDKHTLPVVCIAMDPEDFTTIYSVKNYKDVVERQTFISYYEADGLLGISFAAGLRAKGRGTLAYNQKSMTIRIRGCYGRSTVSYAFFDECEFNEFGSLVLRNGGQDYDEARIRDALASRVMQVLNVDAAATKPVVVYVNGVYYGLFDFGEDLNVDYLATHYGADPDACDLIRTNTTATQGDNKEIKRIIAYVERNSLANSDNYAEFCQWVDVDYMIDYVIAQSFMGNNDMFNQKYWRSRDYSLKWRPILYDLDFAFRSGSCSAVLTQYFNKNGYYTPNGTHVQFPLYIALLENSEWRQKFIERYVEVCCSLLTADKMTAVLDEMVSVIDPEMQRHIARWGYPKSYSYWQNQIASLRTNVAGRPEKALKAVKSYFGLSDSQMNALIAKHS